MEVSGDFARLVLEQASSAHPAARMARELGLLGNYGTLGIFFLMSQSGEVFIDEDDGKLRPAHADEHEFAHVQAARRYPELRHLMPDRPLSASTCQLCAGSAEAATGDGRNRFCCPACNTRGWTI
ncbi:hypothetical protein [Micromonospora sp. LOL_023]|uniref:hypothetical protein n=1 Tax=Micromonospora sp. LOL_023 TaxID=3345418 RepID=UPI003A888A2D